MEEFVAYIIKNLVSKPEDVLVSSSSDQEKVCIEIRVAQEDVGKVIGRRGNTINALRVIVRTVATRLGQKTQVELIQVDQDEREAPKAVASEECDHEDCCQHDACDEDLAEEETVMA